MNNLPKQGISVEARHSEANWTLALMIGGVWIIYGYAQIWVEWIETGYIFEVREIWSWMIDAVEDWVRDRFS